jgi:hypothetical protein
MAILKVVSMGDPNRHTLAHITTTVRAPEWYLPMISK